jgi:hypothetical protein
VLDQIARQGKASFWVLLRQSADLRRAATVDDWDARGNYVYRSLSGIAIANQACVTAYLAGQALSYRSYWIHNSIFVEDGTSATVQDLAARPDVLRIAPEFYAQLIGSPSAYGWVQALPELNQPEWSGQAWGIQFVRADRVWNAFGTQGRGAGRRRY